MFCATPWTGMSSEDIPNTSSTLGRPVEFPDPGRPRAAGVRQLDVPGAGDDPPAGLQHEPRVPGGRADGVIDTTRLVYDGNTQGGIMGGALTAVSPDFDRAVLGVPGMNYSTLLPADAWTSTVRADHVPDLSERARAPAAAGTDPDALGPRRGRRLRAPHDDRPAAEHAPHTVLMQVAFGDHQVSNVTAEVEARTIGARAHTPAFARSLAEAPVPDKPVDRRSRSPGRRSSVGHRAGPHVGAETGGTDPPPMTNTPDRPGGTHTRARGRPRAPACRSRSSCGWAGRW